MSLSNFSPAIQMQWADCFPSHTDQILSSQRGSPDLYLLNLCLVFPPIPTNFCPARGTANLVQQVVFIHSSKFSLSGARTLRATKKPFLSVDVGSSLSVPDSANNQGSIALSPTGRQVHRILGVLVGDIGPGYDCPDRSHYQLAHICRNRGYVICKNLNVVGV